MATDNDGQGARGAPNPLFFGLLAVTVLALVVASAIPPQETALGLNSHLVYRVEVGVLMWLVGYLVLAGLWLAWHRRLFKRLPVPGLGGAESPEGDMEEAANELDAARTEMEEFRSTTKDALMILGERVARIEGRLDAPDKEG